jgi:hypothetical protein
MQERLFRKVALDRLASPEQLDTLLQITPPRAWLSLLSLGLILGGLALWALLAEIPSLTSAEGVLLVGESGEVDQGRGLIAVLYLPLEEIPTIETGMEVRLSPVTAPYQEYGYLVGEVLSIAEAPSRTALAQQLLPGQAAIEVRVGLKADPSTPSGYAWTIGRGPDQTLIPETLVSAEIVTDERSPLSLVLGGG